MKSRIFLLVFISLVLGFSFKVFSQSFETIEIGKGGPPKWSPDGTKLAFMSDGWLCVADAEGKGELKKIAEVNPHVFDWMSDSEFMVWEIERGDYKIGPGMIGRLKTVTLDGKVVQIAEDKTTRRQEPNISGLTILNDGTVGYYEGRFSLPEKDKVFKVIKQGRLKLEDAKKQWKIDFWQGGPGSQIYLRTIDGKQEKRIPNPKGYDCLQLSPDNSTILAANNHGPDYGLFVLDLDGKELAYLGGGLEDTIDLGHGITGRIERSTPKWAPDSKKMAAMFYAEDEWNVIGTDLVVIDVDGNERTRLTNTPDEIETNPVWSPDGMRIAYFGSKSNKIYVLKLK